MKRTVSTVTAIIMTVFASGCNWENLAYGLIALNGGIVVLNGDDDAGCDKWYDFADPGCW